MNIDNTILLIKNYHITEVTDKFFQLECIQLLEKYPDDFYKRTLRHGHLTGSAWIVNPDRNKTLLVHHAKLDKWLQPGGHAEAQDSSIFETAIREAREETGLTSIRQLSIEIFDIDIHTIPARVDFPEHLHYDIRFLFEADEGESFFISNESQDIRWFAMEDLKKTIQNESILRMINKMKELK